MYFSSLDDIEKLPNWLHDDVTHIVETYGNDVFELSLSTKSIDKLKVIVPTISNLLDKHKDYSYRRFAFHHSEYNGKEIYELYKEFSILNVCVPRFYQMYPLMTNEYRFLLDEQKTNKMYCSRCKENVNFITIDGYKFKNINDTVIIDGYIISIHSADYPLSRDIIMMIRKLHVK